MTPTEILSWSRLKNSQLGGLKFRRQESINDYVVDFYCPSKKLAFEVDGDVHGYDSRISADRKRQKEIEDLGIRVIRYTDTDVRENLDAVLQNILQEVGGASTEPPLSPLLAKEGNEGQTQARKGLMKPGTSE